MQSFNIFTSQRQSRIRTFSSVSYLRKIATAQPSPYKAFAVKMDGIHNLLSKIMFKSRETQFNNPSAYSSRIYSNFLKRCLRNVGQMEINLRSAYIHVRTVCCRHLVFATLGTSQNLQEPKPVQNSALTLDGRWFSWSRRGQSAPSTKFGKP